MWHRLQKTWTADSCTGEHPKIPQHPANGMCLCVCGYNIYVCFFLTGNQESHAKQIPEQVNLCVCHDLVASSIVKEHDNKLWWFSWWWWIWVLAISKRYALCYAPPPPPPPPCHHFLVGVILFLRRLFHCRKVLSLLLLSTNWNWMPLLELLTPCPLLLLSGR
jgi:hypothetical protein